MPATVDIVAAQSRRQLLILRTIDTERPMYDKLTAIAPENAELTKTAMWKRLPAVRAGRVFPIPYGTSSPGTAFTLLDAFDRLLGSLA